MYAEINSWGGDYHASGLVQGPYNHGFLLLGITAVTVIGCIVVDMVWSRSEEQVRMALVGRSCLGFGVHHRSFAFSGCSAIAVFGFMLQFRPRSTKKP